MDEWDDETTDTVNCENCGEEVYEDAEQCPYCGWYVTQTTSTFDGKPFWFVLLGIAGIVAVIAVLGGVL